MHASDTERPQLTAGVQTTALCAGKRDHHHLPTMPPRLVPASVISLQSLDLLQVFVHVCLREWLRDSRFQGGSVGRRAKSWHKSTHSVKRASTRSPHPLERGAALLCGCLCGCFGFCVCARQQMVLSCLPVAMGDNRLIRKMSQTVNDEIWLVQTITPLSH